MKRDLNFSEVCWAAADKAIIWVGAENLASQFKDVPWSIVQTFFHTKLSDLARDAYQAVQVALQQEEEAGVLAVCCIRKQLGNVSALVLEGERAKAARMALGQVRHRTLPFRKAANALAPNSTEKALDVHRPFVLGG